VKNKYEIKMSSNQSHNCHLLTSGESPLSLTFACDYSATSLGLQIGARQAISIRADQYQNRNTEISEVSDHEISHRKFVGSLFKLPIPTTALKVPPYPCGPLLCIKHFFLPPKTFFSP